MHDKSVCQEGVYEQAVDAIKAAKAAGFNVNINCTFFDGTDADRAAKFFDDVMAMGVNGITVSPGYAYERAPDQQHFLNRKKTKDLFRAIFRQGDNGKSLALQPVDHVPRLPRRQPEPMQCTPWANPTRNVFGWQRPCYLLGEGYAKTFTELMEDDGLGQVRRRQLSKNAPTAWSIPASKAAP